MRAIAKGCGIGSSRFLGARMYNRSAYDRPNLGIDRSGVAQGSVGTPAGVFPGVAERLAGIAAVDAESRGRGVFCRREAFRESSRRVSGDRVSGQPPVSWASADGVHLRSARLSGMRHDARSVVEDDRAIDPGGAAENRRQTAGSGDGGAGASLRAGVA